MLGFKKHSNPTAFSTLRAAPKALLDRYAFRITRTVRAAMKSTNISDPVAAQYIPQARELVILPEENTDPIGDEAHTPVKGIIHRYPDRVLFKPANACAVYCRYCFRREQVGLRGSKRPDILSEKEIKGALAYIKNHSEIWEVILSGGDPLILSPRQMGDIMQALHSIDHVKVIRFHTRVPIADPTRVNNRLINALIDKTNQSDKALYMILHINHAQELTKEVRATIKTLHQAGINLLSQSVLLQGINNKAETLEELFRALIPLNIKPYYIHHPDLAPGTSHFRLSIEEGQTIMQDLQGRLSGLCQPTYMLDIPGGFGKIPLTPEMITGDEDAGYEITDRHGQKHSYPPKTGKAT